MKESLTSTLRKIFNGPTRTSAALLILQIFNVLSFVDRRIIELFCVMESCAVLIDLNDFHLNVLLVLQMLCKLIRKDGLHKPISLEDKKPFNLGRREETLINNGLVSRNQGEKSFKFRGETC